jgi:hypothetical protein
MAKHHQSPDYSMDDYQVLQHLKMLCTYDDTGECGDLDEDTIDDIRERVCEWLDSDRDRANELIRQEALSMLSDQSVFEDGVSVWDTRRLLNWLHDSMGCSE